MTSAEALAKLFHDTYERLAPEFGYTTREASAKPWDEVPEPNRGLMIAVAQEVERVLARVLAEVLVAEGAPVCPSCGLPIVAPVDAPQWERLPNGTRRLVQ